MQFSTRAIHWGQDPDKVTGAVIPPVYMTSTYVQESPGKHKGYDYTRAGNPNFTNLEATLASLEMAQYATVFSSGLGAMTALLSTLRAEDKLLAVDDLYGGSYRLFTRVFEQFGIVPHFMSMNDLARIETALKEIQPKILFLETPTNPLLKITDIEKVTALAKKYKVLSVVDNTFATSYFQKPLELGADIVLHSTTKYVGGHSDVIGGALMTNRQEFKEKLDFARMALGVNPSPFDTWLLSRSLKTLAIRMQNHEKNALKIAEFLENHPKVRKVYYPGLKSHEGYEIAKKQMQGFGGIVSVEFDLSLEHAKQLISSFTLFFLAESLGGVESLVDHPASMTHHSMPKGEREKIGLSDGLVRFSVGIEDGEDLLNDIKIGLEQI